MIRRALVLAALAALLLPRAASTDIGVEPARPDAAVPAAPRIIALAPHAAELVYAAGAGPQLFASVAHSDHPPAARKLPRIGDSSRLDRERILSLSPDLVIAWPPGNRPGDLEWLQEIGARVYRSQPETLEAIADDLEAIGRLAGTETQARLAAAAFRQRLRELGQRYGRQRPLRLFYQLWPRPLMTVDGRHLISRVLELCGARNIFSAPLTATAASISREAVLAADPEVLVAGVEDGDSVDPLASWRRWGGLAAVGEGNLFLVSADLLHRPGPRILEGAEQLCSQLAPIPDRP